MPDSSHISDRYGLPMTTSSVQAAERYVESVDLLLSQNYGQDDKLTQAIQEDEGYALPHAALAMSLMLQARMTEAKASVDRATSLAARITRREQQQIEVIKLVVDGDGCGALALLQEHIAEFPRDALLLRLAQRILILGCSGAGVASFPEVLMGLLKPLETHYGEDWYFLSIYAFAHHETGHMKEALTLAQKSLDLHYVNAVASHSVAHVYFETGDHSGGGDFLREWLQHYDRRAAYNTHLSWHLALFELAQGRCQSALDLYEENIRPTVQAKLATSLNDSASLMWRMHIYGAAAPPVPWEEVRDQALPAADRPGPLFRDAHAALAFAAAGDETNLGRMIDRLRVAADQGDTLATEMSMPLTQGIGAFAQGEYARAVELMGPLYPQLARIGGSHAQREVFEDTLLEAYLRAEQFENAEEMLTTRLKKRASVRDMFWLGRAQAMAGQQDAASNTLRDATEKWREADAGSPEVVRLRGLAQEVR